MVFKRSLKASIKNCCTKMCLIVVLFTTINLFVFNGAFAASPRVSYPVEIIWTNDNPATRPSQVSLQLKNSGGTNYGSATIFTAANNQDPTNPNRWFGFVSYYNPSQANNLLVVESSLGTDYTITQAAKPTCQANQTVTIVDIHQADSSLLTSGSNHTITNADFILFKQGDNYYGWSAQNNYNANTANNAIHSAIDPNISVSGNRWKSGTNGNQTIGVLTRQSYTNNNSGTSYTYSLSSNIDELYYGIMTDLLCSTSTVTNTGNIVYNYHNVSYSFTGTVQPVGASNLLPATAQYLQGDTVTVASEPTATGYRFLGWQMNGSPVSGTFEMPNNDVMITGSWEQFNGYFSPSISMVIENQPAFYRVLDTVTFKITVTNTESYPISNVVVEELMSGAEFISGSGYTITNAQTANIPTIAANSSVVLYAQYTIPQDITQTLTNTVEITSATAANYYYLDPSHDYEAEVNFNVHAWQDEPVVTGVNSYGTTLYLILMLTGAIGIGARVVIINKKKITKGRK